MGGFLWELVKEALIQKMAFFPQISCGKDKARDKIKDTVDI